MFLSGLQDFPGDELVAALALDAEHGVVVHLAVGDSVLADVLGIQNLVADFALEASQVPMFVQCHQRLFVLEVLPTATAVVDSLDRSWTAGLWLAALLTNTLLPVKGHPVPRWERLFAGGADEAAGVVGLPQRRHHLPLDEVLAAEATSSVQLLVVCRADEVTVSHKESSLGQLAAAHFADETLEVKVFVLNSQSFAPTGFPTILAGDRPASSTISASCPALFLLLLLLQRAMDSLLLEHSFLRHRQSSVASDVKTLRAPLLLLWRL